MKTNLVKFAYWGQWTRSATFVAATVLAGCGSDVNADSTDGGDDGAAGSGNMTGGSSGGDGNLGTGGDDQNGAGGAVGAGGSGTGGVIGAGGSGSGGAGTGGESSSGGANSGGSGSGGETSSGGSNSGGSNSGGSNSGGSGSGGETSSGGSNSGGSNSGGSNSGGSGSGGETSSGGSHSGGSGSGGETSSGGSGSGGETSSGGSGSGGGSTGGSSGVEGGYWQFGTVRSDVASEVAVDADGSVFVAGVLDNLSATPGFIRKYDSEGTELWSQALTVAPEDIDVDVDDGSVVVTGGMIGTGFVVKFDTDGEELWRYENLNWALKDVQVDPAGFVFTSGTQRDANQLQDSVFLKFSSGGGFAQGCAYGLFEANDAYNGTVLGADGGVYLFMRSESTAFTGAHVAKISQVDCSTGYDVATPAVDQNGLPFPGAAVNHVTDDGEGSIYVVGRYPSQGRDVGFVTQYVVINGELYYGWTNSFNAANNSSTLPSSATVTDDGRVFITGQITPGDDVFVHILTSAGAQGSMPVFGTAGFDVGNSIAVGDGRVYVSGVTTGAFIGTNAGLGDAFVAHFPLP